MRVLRVCQHRHICNLCATKLNVHVPNSGLCLYNRAASTVFRDEILLFCTNTVHSSGDTTTLLHL